MCCITFQQLTSWTILFFVPYRMEVKQLYLLALASLGGYLSVQVEDLLATAVYIHLATCWLLLGFLDVLDLV